MDDRSGKSSGWIGNLFFIILLLASVGFMWARQQQNAVQAQRLQAQLAESQSSRQIDRMAFLQKEAELRDQIEVLKANNHVYFAKGAFGADESASAPFVQALRDLREASFSEAATRKEAGPMVRLLWLPTDGHPTAIRLVPPDQSNTLYRLVAVRLDGPAGKLVRGQVGLLPDHKAALDARLGETRLWSAPAKVDADKFGAAGQGGRWLLEAVKDGRYHVLAGASTNDPPFAGVGRTMLKHVRIITGFEIHVP